MIFPEAAIGLSDIYLPLLFITTIRPLELFKWLSVVWEFK